MIMSMYTGVSKPFLKPMQAHGNDDDVDEAKVGDHRDEIYV